MSVHTFRQESLQKSTLNQNYSNIGMQHLEDMCMTPLTTHNRDQSFKRFREFLIPKMTPLEPLQAPQTLPKIKDGMIPRIKKVLLQNTTVAKTTM